MSQTSLAELLEISPSYLSQIEHNQRALSSAVLARLDDALGIDVRALSESDEARTIGELHAALSDSALGLDARTPIEEIRDLVRGYPRLASAIVQLHRRASDARRRFEELGAGLSERGLGEIGGPTTPYDEVLDFVYDKRNHFAELDAAAEVLSTEERVVDESSRALERRLAERHGVSVEITPELGDRRRYDSDAAVLCMAKGLSSAQRAFQMAAQLGLLEQSEVMSRAIDSPVLGSTESQRLARIGLANYFAGAVLLPYEAFLDAAEACRYDIAVLSSQFGVGIETVCHRLSTLGRPERRGVPLFFVRVDRAGNISKRHSATDFHFSRFGGTCPLWVVYDAFSSPGRFITQLAQMPDGRTYLWVARTVTRRPSRFGAPEVSFALGLGCDIEHAPRLVYSQGVALHAPGAAVPIGPGCGICDRVDCQHRAFPMAGGALDIDLNRASAAPYAPRDRGTPRAL